MNLLEQTSMGCGRAAALGALALWLGHRLACFIAQRHGASRTFAVALLIAPFLIPSILTGYAWSKLLLALTMQPFWQEIIYSIALLLRLVPVAALVLHFLPPLMSAQGAACYRLCRGGSVRAPRTCRLGKDDGSWFFLRALDVGHGIAFALVFLLAFGEFELAAFWGIKTWTVAIFDAQAGGMALGKTLQLAAVPVLCQVLMLGLLARLTVAASNRASQASPGATGITRYVQWMSWGYLGIAAGAMVIGPLGFVVFQFWAGLQGDGHWSVVWENLAGNAVLWRDLRVSLFFGIILNSQDEVGLLAWRGTDEWIFPMTPAREHEKLAVLINQLEPSPPTPALIQAFVDAKVSVSRIPPSSPASLLKKPRRSNARWCRTAPFCWWSISRRQFSRGSRRCPSCAAL